MQLEVKGPEHIVPSYSLTGDLLSYLRCHLQYRFQNGSALPPSRPVQQWFGEFLHGTLELAYRFWHQNPNAYPFPWPATQREWRQDPPAWQSNDIGRFADRIEIALLNRGKQARSRSVRDSAFRRVAAAINELGPHLFPLIAAAERKVIGTRDVPPGEIALRCAKYEIHGVIDVLTHVTLGQAASNNLIREAVQVACRDLAGAYEVIVDYKGSQRPFIADAYWNQGMWQVQTYAWLRRQQPDSLAVAAGILFYVNELTPGTEEMICLKQGIRNGTTDVVPERGSADEQIVRLWRPGNDTDQLSLPFRLRRAIRVVPVTEDSIAFALAQFDNVVRQAEEDVVAEANVGSILNTWAASCNDEGTCVACDFRWFCPDPAGGRPQATAP
jgi:hypothetical protein